MQTTQFTENQESDNDLDSSFLMDIKEMTQLNDENHILCAAPNSPFQVISLIERIMLFQDPENVVRMALVNEKTRETIRLSWAVKKYIFPLPLSVLLEPTSTRQLQLTFASTENAKVGITAPFRGESNLLLQDILVKYLLSDKPFIRSCFLRNNTSNAANYIWIYNEEIKYHLRLFFIASCVLLLVGIPILTWGFLKNQGTLVITADGRKTLNTYINNVAPFTGPGSELTCDDFSNPDLFQEKWPCAHSLFDRYLHVIGPWTRSEIYNTLCKQFAKFCTPFPGVVYRNNECLANDEVAGFSSRYILPAAMNGLGMYCKNLDDQTNQINIAMFSIFFTVCGLSFILLVFSSSVLLKTWCAKSPVLLEENKAVPSDKLIPLSLERINKLTDLFSLRASLDVEKCGSVESQSSCL